MAPPGRSRALGEELASLVSGDEAGRTRVQTHTAPLLDFVHSRIRRLDPVAVHRHIPIIGAVAATLARARSFCIRFCWTMSRTSSSFLGAKMGLLSSTLTSFSVGILDGIGYGPCCSRAAAT